MEVVSFQTQQWGKSFMFAQKLLSFENNKNKSLGTMVVAVMHRQKKLGDVTTINLTMLKSGVTTDGGKTWALNVIPTEAEAGFDLRITPGMTTEEMKAKLDEWCQAEGVEWRFAEWTSPLYEHYLTNLDREKNPWWGLFLDVCKESEVEVEPEIFPAGTDSRFIRQIGVPALGFSPIKNTPILLHDNDEYITKDVFLEGISLYENLIKALSSADEFPGEMQSLRELAAGKRKIAEPSSAYLPIHKRTRAESANSS
mmetsp:Transcript_29011/g.37564  ORF Transcript_29011/g.37564 Transcript_29011/m.37564 type:complete len:255 (+) Transcript_29011:746-1510(+)